MQLNLKKPIIFFDLETTGINITKDRIVEISIIKVMPSGEEIEKTRRINPEMPIPAEATAVHHITDEDVAQCPSFKMVAKDLARIFTGCDIAGFNSNRFDIPMLDQEFQRAGVKFDFSKPRFIDVQTIFHKKEQRNLIAAYKFYCGKNLEDAHSANADTRATYEVLKAQLDRYDDLPNDMEKLSEFSTQNRNVDLMGRLIFNDDRKEVINFGKYKGRLAEEVLRQDPGYYSWILKGDFSQNTKDAFTTIKLRLKNA
ncbi:MAG: 3'-5' exonuclease [Duncaniella sp.]|nr:3'-5' exonuclease [Duncaniella sp.]HBI57803.1 DNA polymerase III subunit epsilon [Porphyromonadaceae bacterium]